MSLRLFEFGSAEAPAERMRWIISALHHRRVSVPSDEALCLATLFDLPTDTLTGPEGNTMTYLWRSLSEAQRVPSGIIFFQGLKILEEGFRWAPQSLLGIN